MIEPEVAFADLATNADLAEDFLRSVFTDVLQNYGDDMQFFADRIDKQAITRLENVIESKFQRLDYTDAVDVLKKCGKKFEFPVEWGTDLQSEHERFLCEEEVGGLVVSRSTPLRERTSRWFWSRI